MRLEHLQPLTEGVLKRAFAAATLALASLTPSLLGTDHVPSTSKPTHKVDIKALIAHLSEIAGSKYNVNPEIVKHVVTSAVKHQYSDFPKAKDILAVVGVESSFNPKAVSRLKHDPARGLLQVRPRVWGIKSHDLSSIDQQIKMGADILHKYFVRFGSREAALNAFNVGPKNYILSATHPSKGNPRYVPKVDSEEKMYSDVEGL